MSERHPRRLRVGVLGLGAGLAHVDGYRRQSERYEVVVVHDPDPERVAAARSLVTDVQVAADDEQLLAGDGLDVISIATPLHLHADQVGAALDAGCHVVCEKPVAASIEEIDRLAALSERADRLVVPVFQYRFGRGFQRLLRLVTHGVAGELRNVISELAWHRGEDYYAVSWRGDSAFEPGGVLLMHTIHHLDLLVEAGGGVDRVFARTEQRRDSIDVEDDAVVSLHFANGGVGVVQATLGSLPEVSRQRFCFERLTAESNRDPYLHHRDPWEFTGLDARADADISRVLDDFTPGPELWSGQFARMHEALCGQGEAPVTLGDARRSLEIVTAAYRSAATGTDVGLPLDATFREDR